MYHSSFMFLQRRRCVPKWTYPEDPTSTKIVCGFLLKICWAFLKHNFEDMQTIWRVHASKDFKHVEDFWFLPGPVFFSKKSNIEVFRGNIHVGQLFTATPHSALCISLFLGCVPVFARLPHLTLRFVWNRLGWQQLGWKIRSQFGSECGSCFVLKLGLHVDLNLGLNSGPNLACNVGLRGVNFGLNLAWVSRRVSEFGPSSGLDFVWILPKPYF